MSNLTTQTTAPVPVQKASALVAMANRFSVEPDKLLNTLKGTVFKNATNEQLMALVVVSNEYGLNPFTKQIFAFPDKSGGIIPVVSVDGWLHMMQEHPQFDGIEYEWDRDGAKIISCTAIIYRKDRSKPTRITEFLAECQRNTDPWNKSPSRMLRHRATIQCIRVAFGFSVSDPEDAERATERDVGPIPGKPDLGLTVTHEVEAEPASDPVTPEVVEPQNDTKQPEFPEDADRQTMLADLQKRQDKDGVSDKQIKAWLVAQKLIPTTAIMKKDFSVDVLQALDERWLEITGN